MENIKMYVINLKRRFDRLQKFYESVPFSKEKIDVIYGFDGKNYENESEEEKIIFNKLSKRLNPGEKGCIISHIRIFKDIIKNNVPYAIIMEDDCIFCDDFNNKFEILINEMPLDTKILYFGGRFKPYFKMRENTCSKITENIVAHKCVNWISRDRREHDRCNHGYIISQELAKEFITHFENNLNLVFAIDNWMVKVCINNNIPIYNSYPLLCYVPWFSDSDIQRIY
jgi:glycosyl transferase family 25